MNGDELLPPRVPQAPTPAAAAAPQARWARPIQAAAQPTPVTLPEFERPRRDFRRRSSSIALVATGLICLGIGAAGGWMAATMLGRQASGAWPVRHEHASTGHLITQISNEAGVDMVRSKATDGWQQWDQPHVAGEKSLVVSVAVFSPFDDLTVGGYEVTSALLDEREPRDLVERWKQFIATGLWVTVPWSGDNERWLNSAIEKAIAGQKPRHQFGRLLVNVHYFAPAGILALEVHPIDWHRPY